MFTKCTSNRPQVNRILLGTYTIRSLLRRSSPRSLGKTPNCPPWARRPREPCPVNQTPVLPRARRSFALCSASGSQAGSHTRPLGLRPRGRLHSPPPEPVVTDAGPSLQREGPRRRDQGLGYRGDTQSCSHLGLAPIFGACDPGLPRPRLRAISPLRSGPRTAIRASDGPGPAPSPGQARIEGIASLSPSTRARNTGRSVVDSRPASGRRRASVHRLGDGVTVAQQILVLLV